MNLLLLSAWACGPCPDFDALEVTDPDGVADPAFLDQVERAVLDFASGTGRSGVCVGEVRVVPHIEVHGNDVSGLYRSRGRIDIAADGASPYRMTTHELCHALDRQEGLSDDWGDLPVLDGLDPDLYPSWDAQVRETFAQTCETGPQESQQEALLDTCGFDLDPLAAAAPRVQADVWTQVQRATYADAGLELRVVAPRALDTAAPGWGLSDATALGEDLLLLLRNESPGRGPEYRLLLVDPATGALVGEVELPNREGVPIQALAMRLVPGDAATGLLMLGARAALWEIDLTGEPRLVSHLASVDGGEIVHAVRLGGRMYAVRNTASGPAELAAWDLATGAEVDLDLEGAEWEESDYLVTLHAVETRVITQAWTSGLHELDTTTGAWNHQDLAWAGLAPGLSPREGGPWLAGQTFWTDDSTWFKGMLAWDPDSHQWLLPEEPCSAVVWEPQQSRMVVSGGRVWWLDSGSWEGAPEVRVRISEIVIGG